MKSRLVGLLPLVATLLLQVATNVHAGSFPYVNDFSSTGLTNTSPQYSLDTGNGVLNYVVTNNGTMASTATEPITGIGTSDFVVSTRFLLNGVSGGTTANITVGFGAFGTSSTFASGGTDSFYLADWSIYGAASGAGNLRILNQGTTSGFSAVNSTIGQPMTGNSYELRLTGTYNSGTLDMSLAAFDSLGNQIGSAATASHTAPFTGQFFGFRNRTANATHSANISFDNFNVVPEPSSVVLALGALVGLVYVCRNKSRQSLV
jgi:hypothetical protein